MTRLVILVTQREIRLLMNSFTTELCTLTLNLYVLVTPWQRRRFLHSVPENKVNIIKVIRSILRENVRRNMGTLERGCKERLAPLRSTLPSSARLGERSEEHILKWFRDLTF